MGGIWGALAAGLSGYNQGSAQYKAEQLAEAERKRLEEERAWRRQLEAYNISRQGILDANAAKAAELDAGYKRFRMQGEMDDRAWEKQQRDTQIGTTASINKILGKWGEAPDIQPQLQAPAQDNIPPMQPPTQGMGITWDALVPPNLVTGQPTINLPKPTPSQEAAGPPVLQPVGKLNMKPEYSRDAKWAGLGLFIDNYFEPVVTEAQATVYNGEGGKRYPLRNTAGNYIRLKDGYLLPNDTARMIYHTLNGLQGQTPTISPNAGKQSIAPAIPPMNGQMTPIPSIAPQQTAAPADDIPEIAPYTPEQLSSIPDIAPDNAPSIEQAIPDIERMYVSALQQITAENPNLTPDQLRPIGTFLSDVLNRKDPPVMYNGQMMRQSQAAKLQLQAMKDQNALNRLNITHTKYRFNVPGYGMMELTPKEYATMVKAEGDEIVTGERIVNGQRQQFMVPRNKLADYLLRAEALDRKTGVVMTPALAGRLGLQSAQANYLGANTGKVQAQTKTDDIRRLYYPELVQSQIAVNQAKANDIPRRTDIAAGKAAGSGNATQKPAISAELQGADGQKYGPGAIILKVKLTGKFKDDADIVEQLVAAWASDAKNWTVEELRNDTLKVQKVSQMRRSANAYINAVNAKIQRMGKTKWENLSDTQRLAISAELEAAAAALMK